MQLRKAKNTASRYLNEICAQRYPPVLAAVPGCGSWPYRLYSSVALDILHVMDLSILRLIPDGACEVIANREY